MDEILIGDKKYISSKQAAKATGYAKDYIGQLCREGRVPARLVGRSWYVLESAIHDHRFGDEKAPKEKETQTTETSWEAVHYASSDRDDFPAVHQLLDEERSATAADQEDTLIVGQTPEAASEVSDKLQDAWRAWFDRVSIDAEPSAQEQRQEEKNAVIEGEMRIEQEEIQVPIRAVYTPPPIDLLPRPIKGEEVPVSEIEVEEHAVSQERGRGWRVVGVIKVTGALAALVLALAAAVSTGYLDDYIASYKQVSSFSGVILYNK